MPSLETNDEGRARDDGAPHDEDGRDARRDDAVGIEKDGGAPMTMTKPQDEAHPNPTPVGVGRTPETDKGREDHAPAPHASGHTLALAQLYQSSRRSRRRRHEESGEGTGTVTVPPPLICSVSADKRDIGAHVEALDEWSFHITPPRCDSPASLCSLGDWLAPAPAVSARELFGEGDGAESGRNQKRRKADAAGGCSFNVVDAFPSPSP